MWQIHMNSYIHFVRISTILFCPSGFRFLHHTSLNELVIMMLSLPNGWAVRAWSRCYGNQAIISLEIKSCLEEIRSWGVPKNMKRFKKKVLFIANVNMTKHFLSIPVCLLCLQCEILVTYFFKLFGPMLEESGKLHLKKVLKWFITKNY